MTDPTDPTDQAPRPADGTVTVTEAFLRRIAAGGAIDWPAIDALRHRCGARFIDWNAIDRARTDAENR
ncbi:hypothetical protein [Streptomyces sp. NPDC013489]|uniref:hypothetical protein n=1 Tax=Streptomyces sp. NPDC013489 TaxID=3155606 RepID=UPI0033F650EC